MAITQIRKSVIDLINTVRRKLNLNEVSTLTSDKQSIVLLDLLNDVVEFMSDHGDWLELIKFYTVTAQVGVDTYTFPSNTIVKNIRDLYFNTSRSGLNYISFDDMRRLKIGNGTLGQPFQFALKEMDDNGNPVVWVYPTPSQVEDGFTFSCAYFEKPPIYTTGDADTIVPLPATPILYGLEALALLDESSGEQVPHWQALEQIFQSDTSDAYSRMKGNTGKALILRSSRVRRSR